MTRPLDPYLSAQIAAAAGLPPMSRLPIHKIRAGAVRFYSTGLPPQEVRETRDLLIPGPNGPLRIRIYRPLFAPDSEPLPVTLFFHGSGFVICSIETHDELCRHLCHRSGSIVVSVDYALAPEHPYPAGLEDCLFATLWVAEHAAGFGADPGRIAVAGDSAGGNLATVTAMRLRDMGKESLLRAQLLIYPVTDHWTGQHPSYAQRADGCGLTREDMVWFWGHYLPTPELAEDPCVSPLRAQDLSRLPPAHVVTAEYDVLRDEGSAYAERLAAACVEVELHHYQSVNHGFLFWVGRVPAAGTAMNAASAWLRKKLA
jgi:acetyl esterase